MSFMNTATTDQWVDKAEEDYIYALAGNRQRKRPVPNGVCYHCQQCAEKYLKAYLQSQGEIIERTHDLFRLLGVCAVLEPKLQRCQPFAVVLNSYSIDIRYPGMDATVEDAKDAVVAIRKFRRIVRRIMGL